MASIEALNHLYWAMRVVSYRCTAMAIKMARVLIVALFAVALVAAGAIQHEYSPNGGVQWLPV